MLFRRKVRARYISTSAGWQRGKTVPSQTILVTGSSGLIGFPLACTLARSGHPVIGLDPVPPPVPYAGVDAIRETIGSAEDACNLIAERGIRKIVHAGGISGPMLAIDDPYLVCKSNLIATANLVEAARRADIEKLVYCSSASAFGHTPPAPVPDDAPLRPTNLYGATKGASDLIIGAYREQYGLNAVGLRFSSVYGPGRRTRCAIRTMITNALSGQPSRFDWGEGLRRQYIFVNDAVSAILDALEGDATPQYAYNVAGPDFVEMAQIAEIVKNNLPDTEITFGEGSDELGYRRDRLDIAAAERDLGFSPQYGIERGVIAYLTWYRNSGTLPYLG